MFRNFKKDINKKGQGATIITLAAVLFLGIFITLALTGRTDISNWISSGTSNPQLAAIQDNPTSSPNNIIEVGVEDVTVTFSSYDFYSKSTNGGTGNLILQANGDIGIQVNDDGTRPYSPGQDYKVLIGNVTTSITANTGYYPV